MMLNTKEARDLAREWASAPQVRGTRCPALASLDGFPIESLLGWVSATMAAEVESRAAKREMPDNDREALAHAVAKALGEPFTDDPHGEHGLAWDLCELAGWPDAPED